MGEVRLETADGILTATLADVENRNALGAAILNGLHDAIRRANEDPEIRAVVVTNEGTTFCAGANLKEQSGAARGVRPKVGFDELLDDMGARFTQAVNVAAPGASPRIPPGGALGPTPQPSLPAQPLQ